MVFLQGRVQQSNFAGTVDQLLLAAVYVVDVVDVEIAIENLYVNVTFEQLYIL